MHFSINMQDYKQFYPYKQNNLTYLVYGGDCFDNVECDFKLKLWQECDKIENLDNVRNHLTRNLLSLTQK